MQKQGLDISFRDVILRQPGRCILFFLAPGITSRVWYLRYKSTSTERHLQHKYGDPHHYLVSFKSQRCLYSFIGLDSTGCERCSGI